MPVDPDDNHSTAVAGLALAKETPARHDRRCSGRAACQLENLHRRKPHRAEERMMDMFQYHSNAVSVQNHSWGNVDFSQLPPLPLESLGISNASPLDAPAAVSSWSAQPATDGAAR